MVRTTKPNWMGARGYNTYYSFERTSKKLVLGIWINAYIIVEENKNCDYTTSPKITIRLRKKRQSTPTSSITWLVMTNLMSKRKSSFAVLGSSKLLSNRRTVINKCRQSRGKAKYQSTNVVQIFEVHPHILSQKWSSKFKIFS